MDCTNVYFLPIHHSAWLRGEEAIIEIDAVYSKNMSGRS